MNRHSFSTYIFFGKNIMITYIAKKCYPVDGSSWVHPFYDFFDYINDF